MNQLLEWQKTQHLLPPPVPGDPLQNNSNPGDPTMTQYHNGYDQHQHQQYQQTNAYNQPWQSQQNGNREIGAAFSLRSVRQSLEQGVERLSSNGTIDSLKNRLVTEWNGLTALQKQQSQATGIPLDASSAGFYREHEPVLFSDGTGMAQQHQRQQPAQLAPQGIVQSGSLAQPQGSQLAHRLGNSVAILQDFAMKVARESPQQQQPQQRAMLTPQEPKVPTAVWEALAELEGIRSVLQQHNY